jgi:hypothetical protein
MTLSFCILSEIVAVLFTSPFHAIFSVKTLQLSNSCDENRFIMALMSVCDIKQDCM